MSESKLDRIVKGAPAPDASIPPVPSSLAKAQPGISSEKVAETTSAPPLQPSDPLSTLPSSPPQIYLNLLILEASLRSQYLTLRARRRQHTFFLLLLLMWNACCFYALFLRPREDGRGLGGSVYWVVEMAEKVALMGGIVTGILIWGTGQWERGIRWPRRWVGVANRGLRGMNTKLVIIKGPWWKETLSHLSFLFPYSSFFPSKGSSFHYIERSSEKHRHETHGTRHLRDDEDRISEEDLAPGGDYVKLLLLPKPFSPDFRENWELYRTEYWEKENDRRAQLRQVVVQREREEAKQQGGFLWWTGWRGWRRAKGMGGRGGDVEKSHRLHSERDPRFRLASMSRSESHSRNSSRSTTPTPDLDERPILERTIRRGSHSSTSERRLKNKSAQTSAPNSSSSRGGKSASNRSHNTAPASSGSHSPLIRGLSSMSTSSGYESDKSITSIHEGTASGT
ncbi:MAG: hypothetical protein M1835_003422 [Candelina submexicana]|nr:MAG: hypothetical protein M1835_003422 [Candelina submexicana]